MRVSARPWVAAAALAVLLLTTGGCFWDEAEPGGPPAAKQQAAQGPAAGQPEAAQQPRPGSEPLFHVTSSTGGEFHEFEISGGFTVRFACKGAGAATVTLDARTRYDFTCSAEAPEQLEELRVSDRLPHVYRVAVKTTSAKNTWSIFFDRLRG